MSVTGGSASIEDRLRTALARCDAAKSYRELVGAFKRHVWQGVVVTALNSPLKKAVDDSTPPELCCGEVSALRDALHALNCDDVWFLLTMHAPTQLLRAKRGRDDSSASSIPTSVATGMFVLFRQRGIPDVGSLSCRWPWLKDERNKTEKSAAYVNSNSSERRKLVAESALCVFSDRMHRQQFTALWMKLLAVAPPELSVHLLCDLSTYVVPHLTNPILLADYLTSCCLRGGLVAVLSLKGLLLLMLDHGLEQPNFYELLYRLITPSMFATAHRYQLFKLVDLCMKSLRVPATIAASFIKRVAQTSLLAPTPSLYFALPFIRQLLQRHPNCLCLIHRTLAERNSSAAGETVAPASLFDGQDPYDAAEQNPTQTNALGSSLWELCALERQFVPAVSLMVSALASPVQDNTPLSFEKTYGRLFTAELTRSRGTAPVRATVAPIDDAIAHVVEFA